MENIVAEHDLNYGIMFQEDSEIKNFSLLLRGISCDILLKNMVAFFLCPRSLPESKVKRLTLIVLRIENAKLPSIDSFNWFANIKSVLIKYSKLRKKKFQDLIKS